MHRSRLSDMECAVTLALQFDADATVQQVARRINARTHTVHYALSALLERRILRPWLAVNHYTLGLEQFDVFFSLLSANTAAKAKLLQTLATDSRILWYAELGGEFQYAFSLYARNSAEASVLLDDLARKSRALLVKKQVSAVVFFALFKKRYLAQSRAPYTRGSIQFEQPATRAELDQLDYRILSSLYDQPLASRVMLARSLDIPRSTLELRIKRLRARGILLAFIYHVSAATIGAHSYKILISIRGVRPDLRRALLQYADASENVVNFGVCFGAWDFELGVEVFETQEVATITGNLYDRFGEVIDSMHIIPIFKRNVSNHFMRPFPLVSANH